MYLIHLKTADTLHILDIADAIRDPVLLEEYIDLKFVHRIPHKTRNFFYLHDEKDRKKHKYDKYTSLKLYDKRKLKTIYSLKLCYDS